MTSNTPIVCPTRGWLRRWNDVAVGALDAVCLRRVNSPRLKPGVPLENL